jgi:hypothetical protein
MKRIVFLALVAGLASACASAQAKSPADRPALEVPAPPPRAIEPTPKPETSSSPEPVSDLPPASPTTTNRPSRPATRDTTPRTEPKPPEAPPAEQPAAAAAPPVAPAPAPQLRTPGNADGPEAAKQVRDLLDKAGKALNAVDYQRLNKAQKGQYNNAKLMLTQAEEQLKGSNFDIARNLAEKATRIATELQGR